MTGPSEMIRKARMNARVRPTVREDARVASETPSRHASYTRLMRSHDRVRTRHLAGQNGK